MDGGGDTSAVVIRQALDIVGDPSTSALSSEEEQELLEEFAVQHANSYDFSSSQARTQSAYLNLYKEIWHIHLDAKDSSYQLSFPGHCTPSGSTNDIIDAACRESRLRQEVFWKISCSSDWPTQLGHSKALRGTSLLSRKV